MSATARAGWVRYNRPIRSHYYDANDYVSACQTYGDTDNERIDGVPMGDACGACLRIYRRKTKPVSDTSGPTTPEGGR